MFGERLQGEDRKGNLFGVVKQLVKENRDVTDGGSVKDEDGKVILDEEKLMGGWRVYYDRLSNQEFDCKKKSYKEGGVVSEPCSG